MSDHKRKKKRHLWKGIIVCLLFIASAFVGGKAAYLQYELTSAVNHSDVSLEDVEVDASALYEKDVINILLIGADERSEWHDSGRSDSSMIATLDLKNGQLKLTSLMRDMYVEIPEHQKNRFNAAYKFGGVSLLYQTIATNFNVRLDGYVVVDFKAFRDVINKLGGVEITLTEKEARYLNTAYHGKITVDVGKQKLTGKEALAYTRIRQVATDTGKLNDFGRTERQRRVLDSIFSQFKNESFGDLKDILILVLNNVTTDLSDKQINSLVFSMLKIPDKEIKQLCLPVEGAYTPIEIVLPNTSKESKVLDINVDMNRNALQNFIFNKYDESTYTGTGSIN